MNTITLFLAFFYISINTCSHPPKKKKKKEKKQEVSSNRIATSKYGECSKNMSDFPLRTLWNPKLDEQGSAGPF